MSLSVRGFSHLPIEYISLDNTIPFAFLILGFIHVSLYIILDWDSKIYSFFLGSKCSSSTQQEQSSQLNKSAGVLRHEKKSQDPELLPLKEKKYDEISVCNKDVDVVFRSLGILGHPPQEQEGGPRFEERIDCNYVFDLFEKKEPSGDEVKAAFDVFDENKDGFIDAKELQRLLCALGLKEGSELENCRRMIRAVDENGDEKIDFNEFVNFMETIFC